MMNRKFQLGYTLVEIALVLTVALMMASWLAANFFEWKRNLDNQAAARDIKIIKESIIDYAADHSAGASELFNPAVAVTIYHRLPSGRPYLPCPDTTGDGVENRGAYVPGGIVTVTANTTVPVAGENALQALGSGCIAEKGFVPWKTLGTPPSDPWGNRYTYRVDPTFADHALGFDQETESSDRRPANELYVPAATSVTIRHLGRYRFDFFPAIPEIASVTVVLPVRFQASVGGRVVIDIGTNAEIIATLVPVIAPLSPPSIDSVALASLFIKGFRLRSIDNFFVTDVPSAIGDPVFQNPVAANAGTGRPGIICSESPCSSAVAATLLAVGDIAAAPMTVVRGGYDLDVPIHIAYDDNNIINGLPVVVLSHGENGYGAVPFQSGTLSAVPNADCHEIPPQNLDEIQNALGLCQPTTLPVALQGAAQSYGFVARPLVSQRTGPRNAAITQEFDDVVGWLSADEIIEALRRRGTLPVGLLPPVGLEEY